MKSKENPYILSKTCVCMLCFLHCIYFITCAWLWMGFGFRRFSSNKCTPVITGVAIGTYILWHGSLVVTIGWWSRPCWEGGGGMHWLGEEGGNCAPSEAVAVVSSDARGWGRGFLNGRHPVLHQRHVSPGGSHYGHVLGTNLLVSSWRSRHERICTKRLDRLSRCTVDSKIRPP